MASGSKYSHFPVHLNKLIPLFLSGKIFILFLLSFILINSGWGQTTSVTYTSSGSFRIPAGVTEIVVEAWGAGGGGSSRAGSAGGGGGGAYARGTLTGLVPGSFLNFTVGTGGTAGSNGGNTTFGTIVANGGNSTNTRTGGTGGAASALSGNVTASYAGGNGGSSRIGGGGNDENGGGGGGSAFTNANGNDGTGLQNSGTIPSPGGTGTGNGGQGACNDGNPNALAGAAPGGGGGGRGEGGGTSRAGANGQVRITWTPVYKALFTSMDYGSSTWYAGETRTVKVTVINNGLAPWTDSDPDINIGVKWNADADYLVRVDAGDLAIGALHEYSLTITAPVTAGTENLTFDAICEGYCEFASDTSACGLGNTVYTSGNITILPSAYTYTSNGNITIMPGITSVKVQAWGGGGGGSSINDGTARRGGGGGGGAYAASIVPVIPGNTYAVTVGGAGAAGSAGGPSSFGTNLVVAAGGSGAANNGTSGGLGGTVAASTGTTKFAGGLGADGGGTWSGGGGGGAGTTGNGGDAAGATAGTGTPLNGGPGGAGVSGRTAGNAGSIYGGGGSGAASNNGASRTGGSGAGGYIIITLPSSVVLSSPSQIPNDTVFQGDLKHPIFSFATSVSSSDALLTDVTFTTAGTYSGTDVTRFQLWYSSTNNFGSAVKVGPDIGSSLGTGSHSFSGINQIVGVGTTGYFWITTDVSNTAVTGRTLSVNAFTSTNLTYEIANVIGSTSAGGTQLIQPTANISISSANPAVPAASVAQGTIDQQVYAFNMAVTNADAVLTSLNFTTSNSCDGTDLVRFKLWYNTSNNFASAFNIGSGIISGLGAGTHTFSDLSQLINTGTTGYFWITVDITPFPTNGHTLRVSAITISDLTFERAIKSGTTSAGDIMTISTTTGIMLGSTRPAVSANSVLQGSVKQPVYKFTTIITGSNATLTGVSFTTSGTYLASDVVNFKLWYNTINSLVGATQIGSVTTSTGTGSHTFGSFTSTTTNAGNTGYFWITADLSASAVAGRTLYVNAITTANLTYSAGAKTGTAYDGGVQTIQNNIDTEGDGVADLYDWDDDDDGIPDITENEPCNTTTLELFPNTDFSAGNTGFSSAYGYAVPARNALWDEGKYSVVTNPNSVHDNFTACGDHTTGTGNMMVVNANPIAGKIVWSSGAIAVTPNTDYTLSFYVATVCMPNPAQLIWNVNGENIGSQFNATGTTCEWVNAVAIWNSGNKTSATFDIINLNIVANGNDFALDDISCKYRINCDSDGDGVQDRLDLDSDNDGIYDVYEAGGTDANFDGIIDSYATDADNDGLADAVDNQDAGNGASEVKNGTPLTNPDTDLDGLPNIIDRESDNDGCFDAYEAGFNDQNNDGILGNTPVTYDSRGKVTSSPGSGYSLPLDGNGDGTRDFMQRIPIITSQPQNSNICAPSTGTTFSVVATGVTSYQWQVNQGSGWNDISDGGVYSGANTANLVISSAVTISYDGYQYRVQLTSSGYRCSPITSNSVTLRVFTGAPATPGAISGNTTVCPSIISVYSITPVAQALSYSWTVPAGWSIISGGTSATVTVLTASGGGNISVTATNSCGTSAARSLAVSIGSPSPSFSATPADPSCQGSDLTYTTEPLKTNYAWTFSGTQFVDYTIISGGGSSDNSVTLRWLTTGSKTVTVNYTSGGCQGATPASNSITVNANAIILTHPANPAAICANAGVASMSVTASGTISGYRWQIFDGSSWVNLNNDATYSNVTTSILTITNPAAGLNNGQYHCVVTGSCGTVTSNAATLTVNSIPADPGLITGTAAQCPSLAGQTYSIAAVTNATTYTWSVPAGWSVTAGAGTTSITVTTGTAGQNGNITVTAGNSCGTSGNSSLGVTVNPGTPAAPGSITGTAAQCPSLAGQTYSVAAVANATTYTWTVPAGWTVTAGAGTTSITVTTGTTGQDGNITVTAGNSCGTSGNSSLAVTVNPGTPAAPGAITGTVAQCPLLAAQTYSITAVANATTYTWTVPAGWTVTAGAGTTSITVTTGTAGQNGNITVTAGNSCGTSSNSSLAVTVNQRPAIANTSASAYSGNAFTVSPVNGTDIVPAGTTYSWPLPVVTGGLTGGATGSGAANISGTLNNPTSSAQTATYTVTPVAAGCIGSDFTITVTVNAIPVISDMSSTVCSGTAFSVVPVDGTNGIVPAGTNYSWNIPVVTGGMTGGATGSNAAEVSGTLTNSTNSAQTATYTVTPSVGSYTGNDFTVTVTVNPLPTITLDPSTTTVCRGLTTSDLTYTGTTNSPDQYSIVYSAPAIAQGFTNVTNTLLGPSPVGLTVPSGALADDYNAVLTVRNTSTGCMSPDNSFLVRIHPLPVPSLAGNDSICEGETISYQTDGGMSDYVWTITAGSGSIVPPDNTNSIDVNWGSVTGQYQERTVSVTYTDSNGCDPSSPGQMTIWIFRIPQTGPSYYIPNNLNE